MSALKYLTKKVAAAENEVAKARMVESRARRRTDECLTRAEAARRELDHAIEDRIRKARGLDTVECADSSCEEKRQKAGVPV